VEIGWNLYSGHTRVVSYGRSVGFMGADFGVLGGHMNKKYVPALFAVAFVTAFAFPNSGFAQGKSLKDQVVGTWIYVSSTGKRDDGSTVLRPSLQGAVTYTADGRFHFITTRTEPLR